LAIDGDELVEADLKAAGEPQELGPIARKDVDDPIVHPLLDALFVDVDQLGGTSQRRPGEQLVVDPTVDGL